MPDGPEFLEPITKGVAAAILSCLVTITIRRNRKEATAMDSDERAAMWQAYLADVQE